MNNPRFTPRNISTFTYVIWDNETNECFDSKLTFMSQGWCENQCDVLNRTVGSVEIDAMNNPRCRYTPTNVSDLLGVTLSSIKNDDNESIKFVASDGREWIMYHGQDCCEHVSIDDINGDLNSLVGSPLTLADVSSSYDDEINPDNGDACVQWTFYRFATVNGYVDIRWYGSSNGYYSTAVDFAAITYGK